MDFMEFGGSFTNVDEEMFDIDSDSQYAKFDATVGHIEDIVMSDEFQSMQKDFFDKYYHEFEDSEENKFIYTDIHKEYTNVVESFLVQKLKEVMTDFSMEEFFEEFKSKKVDLDEEGEIFEILFSFSDFLVFKDMMLSHGKSKDNLGLFDDLVSVMPLGQMAKTKQEKEGMTLGLIDKPSSCLQLSALSLQSGSLSASTLPTHVSAHISKPRPNSSKGPRKAPSFHHPPIPAPTQSAKGAKDSVPSTSKHEYLSSHQEKETPNN